MIFILIGIAIMIYGLFNYKKSFMLFLLFKIVLNGNIILLTLSQGKTITLELIMILYYITLFIIKGNKYKTAKIQFPYKNAFIFIAVSWLISSFFAIVGFGTAITRTLSSIVAELVFIYLIWELVEEEKDFKFLFKYVTIIFCLSCVYGILEYFIQKNPLIEYESMMGGRDFSYDVSDGRGYRVQSVFEHAIGAGINWAMYIVWMYSALIKTKWKIPIKYLAIFTTVMCLLGIFFTKSRAPIVFLLIAAFSIVNLKNRRFYILMISVVVVIALCIPLLNDSITKIVMSIFDSSLQNEVSGSNVKMRLEQLKASFQVLKESPIYGLGVKFTDVYSDKNILRQLRGLESIWFVTMTYYGIVGVLAQLYLAYNSLINLPKKFKSKEMFFISLAYWITYSMTTVPGMLIYLYYIIMFFYIKNSVVYKEKGILITEKNSCVD